LIDYSRVCLSNCDYGANDSAASERGICPTVNLQCLA